MIPVSCPPEAPPPAPAAIVRRASPNPAIKRPVVRLKPAPTQAKPKPRPKPLRVTTLCNLPPAPPAGLGPLKGLQLAATVSMPAVPTPSFAELAEPLTFAAPGAGPAPSTWTLASAPPPQWWPVPAAPWISPGPVPAVSEPGTLWLALAGVLAILWRKR